MKRVEDERVVNIRRKINSEAFGLCFIGLMVILLYRGMYLDQSFKEIWDIFALFLIVAIYNNVKVGLHGVAFVGKREKRNFKRNVIISTIVATVAFMISAGYRTGNGIEFIQIMIFIVAFGISWVTAHILYVKWSDKQANKDIED